MDCPIHLGAIALKSAAAAALRCGHVFCLPCITGWIESKRAAPCPVCKTVFTRTNILRLYAQPRSPTSSPTKSERPGQLSAIDKAKGRELCQDLQILDVEGTSGNVEKACAEMDRFADVVAGTSADIEAKCLGEEIKSAAIRFQSLILPELKELESLRMQILDLKGENAHLTSMLHQKTKQVDAANRQSNTLKQDVANLKMSKNIADNNCSGLRQTLDVTEEKLVDAQNAIRTKDETIQAKDVELLKYKGWLAQHKSNVEALKAEVRGLESRLDEQSLRHDSANRGAQKELEAWASSAAESLYIEPENDGEHSAEPSAKRRRVGNESLSDVKLDRSCFVTKSRASFQIPKKKPERRPAGPTTIGLHIQNGQVKGVAALGSRARLGKKG